MELRTLLMLLLEFLSVVSSCSIIGSGIGLLVGLCAFSAYEIEWQFKFSVWAAVFAGITAGIIGPILYYILFRKRISLESFFGIVSFTFAVGLVSAYLLRAEMGKVGWILPLITPGAVIAASYYVWARLPKQETGLGPPSRS
jgi:hypothetical protein